MIQRKPKVKKRRKKNELRAIKARLDKLFSLYIRLRDGYTCKVCGSRDRPQCGHIFSRVSLSTRWDDSNAVCQCASCNMRHEFDPYPLNNWYITQYGKEKWDDLYRQWHKVRQWKLWELEELEAKLKEKLQGGAVR